MKRGVSSVQCAAFSVKCVVKLTLWELHTLLPLHHSVEICGVEYCSEMFQEMWSLEGCIVSYTQWGLRKVGSIRLQVQNINGFLLLPR